MTLAPKSMFKLACAAPESLKASGISPNGYEISMEPLCSCSEFDNLFCISKLDFFFFGIFNDGRLSSDMGTFLLSFGDLGAFIVFKRSSYTGRGVS